MKKEITLISAYMNSGIPFPYKLSSVVPYSQFTPKGILVVSWHMFGTTTTTNPPGAVNSKNLTQLTQVFLLNLLFTRCVSNWLFRKNFTMETPVNFESFKQPNFDVNKWINSVLNPNGSTTTPSSVEVGSLLHFCFLFVIYKKTFKNWIHFILIVFITQENANKLSQVIDSEIEATKGRIDGISEQVCYLRVSIVIWSKLLKECFNFCVDGVAIADGDSHSKSG